MKRTNIYLDEDTHRTLRLLAAARGTAMSDLVREAVDDMLAKPRQGIDWKTEIEGLLDRVRDRNLPDLTSREIATELREARAEARRAKR